MRLARASWRVGEVVGYGQQEMHWGNPPDLGDLLGGAPISPRDTKRSQVVVSMRQQHAQEIADQVGGEQASDVARVNMIGTVG